jgi:hypothetical protein
MKLVRHKRLTFVAVPIFVAWLIQLSVVLAAPTDMARALFDRYVELEHAFDPTVADLYADDALIEPKLSDS